MTLLDLRSLVESFGAAAPVNNTRPATLLSHAASAVSDRQRVQPLTVAVTATLLTRARTLNLVSPSAAAVLAHKTATLASRTRVMAMPTRDKVAVAIPHKQSYVTSRVKAQPITSTSAARLKSR